jgi:hypothetical protein
MLFVHETITKLCGFLLHLVTLFNLFANSQSSSADSLGAYKQLYIYKHLAVCVLKCQLYFVSSSQLSLYYPFIFFIPARTNTVFSVW